MEISIVIPCHDDGQYLPEAIRSIRLERLTQTEVIIVDDGSTDTGTLKILGELSGPNISVFHITHSGPSVARNEGIRRASGRYILPLDADDRIEPEYLDKAKAILDSAPNVGAVYCHADLFGDGSGKWALPDYSFDRMLIQNIVFVTAMFRKSDWEAVGGFRRDMVGGLEDYDFFISILASGKEIRQLPDVFFHYRIRKDSRTAQFMNNVEITRALFRKVYEHHEEFYLRHARRYICLLRDELIEEQMKERRGSIRNLIDRVRRIPVIGNFLSGAPYGR